MKKLRILGYIYGVMLITLLISYLVGYSFTEWELFSDNKEKILYTYDFIIKDNSIVLAKLKDVDVSSYYHQFNIFLNQHKYGLDDNVSLLVYKYNLLSDAELQVIKELMESKKQAEEEAERLAKEEEQKLRLVAIAYLGAQIIFWVLAFFHAYASGDFKYFFIKPSDDSSEEHSSGSSEYSYDSDDSEYSYDSDDSEYSYDSDDSSENSLESLESYHSEESEESYDSWL